MIKIYTVTNLREYKKVLTNNIGKEILLRDLFVDDLISYGAPIRNNAVECGVVLPAIWQIDFCAVNSKYLFRASYIKREEFFQLLMQNYPKHFEELLFHPEFMR